METVNCFIQRGNKITFETRNDSYAGCKELSKEQIGEMAHIFINCLYDKYSEEAQDIIYLTRPN